MRTKRKLPDPLSEEESYRIQSAFCRTFSHPRRLQILSLLADGEMSVGEIAQRLGMSMANVSQHLALMREKGALRARKQGQTVFYRVATPLLLDCLDLLRKALLDTRSREHESLSRGIGKGAGGGGLRKNQRRRRGGAG